MQGRTATTRTVMLKPHRAKPPVAVSGVVCTVSWNGSGDWTLDFIVAEPPEALRLPEAVTPSRADGLWQTTCFELFLRRPGERGYMEFNFSPSGQWAAYTFLDYRDGGRDMDVRAPLVRTEDPRQFKLASLSQLQSLGVDPVTAARLVDALPVGDAASASQFAATVTLEDPEFFETGPWLVALSAVIEEAHGAVSYWALAHPSDKPDFHHPDSFILELP